MSPDSNQPEKNRKQYLFNLTLAAVAGQVGCLTLVIIFAALFGGLWLDARFGSGRMFTVGLLIASIPVTLVAMFLLVRAATSRLTSGTDKETTTIYKEEANGGK